MPQYLSVAQFQEWARDDISLDASLISQAIAAAEGLINDQAGRALIVVDESTVATLRSFRPQTEQTIWIPDAHEVTEVTENGATLAVDVDYVLEPFDQLSNTGEYRPYNVIQRLDTCWYRNCARPTVSITAKWGWATIPPVVVEACKVLTADWLEHRNVRLGVVGSTADGFSIGVRSSPAVQQAINTIRGPLTIGIA